MNTYIYTPLSVSDKDAFSEASKEELRVLLALIECDGRFENIDTLAALARTSKARASSALVFWQEARVITAGESVPTITEEFEERLDAGKIREESSSAVAGSIRSEALADMISECAALMSRAALNTTEIKQLTALHEQYALSAEFIVTLAAYLSEKGKLTVTKLVNKAIKLTEREIETIETLEEYIAEKDGESEVEREFRRIFGIYGRALSPVEKECFKKWSSEYGYYTEIVQEAFSIAASYALRGLVKYVDKLLTRWYEAGCRTLAECKARYEADEAEMKSKNTFGTKSGNTKKSTERYGDFDAEQAFLKALERSYGSSEVKDQ